MSLRGRLLLAGAGVLLFLWGIVEHHKPDISPFPDPSTDRTAYLETGGGRFGPVTGGYVTHFDSLFYPLTWDVAMAGLILMVCAFVYWAQAVDLRQKQKSDKQSKGELR
jgi:hypothetical protein